MDGSNGDNGCRSHPFGENRRSAGPRKGVTADLIPSGIGSSNRSRGWRPEPANVPAGCVVLQKLAGGIRPTQCLSKTGRDCGVPSDGESRRDGWRVLEKQWRSCGTALVLRGTCQWKASLLGEASPPFTRGGVEAGLIDGEPAVRTVGELRGDGTSEAQSLGRLLDQQSRGRDQRLAEAGWRREASAHQGGGRPLSW